MFHTAVEAVQKDNKFNFNLPSGIFRIPNRVSTKNMNINLPIRFKGNKKVSILSKDSDRSEQKNSLQSFSFLG